MALAGLLVLALAPQQAPPPPRERARVEYVLVDVRARDRDGHLVTDLTLADFTLRENGRPITLQSLDILDLRGEEPRTQAEPREGSSDLPLQRPVIRRARVILALDFEFTDYRAARKTFDELEGFLAKAPARRNLEYLVYSLEGGRLMDRFDENPQVAREALDRYREEYLGRRHAEAGEVVKRASREPRAGPTDDLAELEKRFQSCRFPADNLPTTQVDFSPLWNCVVGELTAFLEVQNGRTATVLTELETLAGRFEDTDSLKSIVFVSPGFSLRPGAAALRLARDYLRMPGRMTTVRGHDDPGRLPSPMGGLAPLPSPRSFDDQFARVLDRCARNQVVFHTFDIYNLGMAAGRRSDVEFRGGGDRGAYSEYRAELDGGLEQLARTTGGSFHTASTLVELDGVLEASRFVYVLGYVSPPGERGQFRNIKVQCRRKGIKLQHRAGYFG